MCKCENVQIYNNAFNYSFYNYKALICTFTHFSRIFTFTTVPLRLTVSSGLIGLDMR